MGRRIVRTRGVCGGRARLFGTSIEVCQVIRLLNRNGSDLEELWEAFPQLTMGDLDLIKRHYQAHSGEIDRDMAEEE